MPHIILFLRHGGDLARHCYEFWKPADFQFVGYLVGKYPSLKEIRADKGYRGRDVVRTAREHGLNVVCTKSNAGDAVFVPVQGR